MIGKQEFLEIYKSLEKFVNEGNRLASNKALNSEVFLDFEGFGWETIEKLFTAVLEKDGVDWIYWWFFEKPYLKSDAPHATDKNGNPIPTETVEDLWNIISEYRLQWKTY